jgi:hypothetical protein
MRLAPTLALGITVFLPDQFCLPRQCVPERRLFRARGRGQQQQPAATDIQVLGRVGKPRGLAPAVGAHPQSFWMAAVRCSVAAAHGDAGAGACGHGLYRRGFPVFLPVHLQSLRASAPGGACRWQGPQPAAAGSRADHSSASALHGLRGFQRGLRLSPWQRCSAAAWMRPGRAGRVPGPTWPGLSSAWGSCSAAGGPTTSWAGAAGGSGIRWRTRPSCPGWRARR